ncbi:hypothetical protein A2960_06500 [Candidatus Gottesmanbacteria bacterium RIFCSPLOWO2_01_FULL_39_12b]|uniref:Uncharacterized protein n=1 Tax=Candidatus Gottesmanbacteria bacterium RIFCSPLOWO2_01_FULL_39_12b TaxID=1798388 RepID=A0A1F6ARV3_9BACT|nr:MAG: hypothetical protein A2960_06500 [Candidatus Gottesmanbacteria bacterium RIFCSPLOWO2_01_FULL_39_12b]
MRYFSEIYGYLKKNRRLLLISILILSILIFLMIKNINSNPKPVPIVSTPTQPTEIIISPVPQNNPPFDQLVNPSITEAPYSGAHAEDNQKILESNPSLMTEAKLQGSVPLEFDGFILDYSYADDKFLVNLQPPYDESRTKFANWMKDNGLPSIDRFILIEQ